MDPEERKDQDVNSSQSEDQETLPLSISESVSLLTTLTDNRKALVLILREEAKQLNEMAKNVRISEISGSTAGIVGGAMIVAGVLGAPFTFGGSLALTGTGYVLSAAGGLTSAVAAITEYVINKNTREKINKLLKKDEESMGQLNDTLAIVYNSVKFAKGGSILTAKGVKALLKLFPEAAGNAAANAANLAARIPRVARFGGRILRVIRVGSSALTFLALPLDVYNLVSNSKYLHEGTQTELAKRYTEIADQIESTEKDLNNLKIKLSNCVQ
ncbi:apolipoprotein L3-like [Patella vulgata]|uniref:apolipoprotein L3-like n=1 Tax=Patella vulgata TaxID=6465 RepID=UPI0021807C03|nr:apolipoprotein L3-like [Patella vulgata]